MHINNKQLILLLKGFDEDVHLQITRNFRSSHLGPTLGASPWVDPRLLFNDFPKSRRTCRLPRVCPYLIRWTPAAPTVTRGDPRCQKECTTPARKDDPNRRPWSSEGHPLRGRVVPSPILWERVLRVRKEHGYFVTSTGVVSGRSRVPMGWSL